MTSASSPAWPAYSSAFFLSAIAFLFAGIGLGLFMAASHDYALRPVHAHLNLLGWVTSAIMGLFYAHVGARLNVRAIWAQFGFNAFGVVVGMAGLAGRLLDIPGLEIALALGTLSTVISVVMFAWMIVRAGRRPSISA